MLWFVPELLVFLIESRNGRPAALRIYDVIALSLEYLAFSEFVALQTLRTDLKMLFPLSTELEKVW